MDHEKVWIPPQEDGLHVAQPGQHMGQPGLIPLHDAPYQDNAYGQQGYGMPMDAAAGTQGQRRRICGIPRRVCLLATPFVVILVVAIALGVGLGVGLGQRHTSSSPSPEATASPSATPVTSLPSAASVTSPPVMSSSATGASTTTASPTSSTPTQSSSSSTSASASPNPSPCPSGNGTFVNEEDGSSIRQYRVYCDSDIQTPSKQTIVRSHARTLKECVDVCDFSSDAYPGIAAVWNWEGTGQQDPGTCWCVSGANAAGAGPISNPGNILAALKTSFSS